MSRILIIVCACIIVGCEDTAPKVIQDQWEGYSEHEKVFECMYSRDMDHFPESIAPIEDYALIIYGHWEHADDVPEIAAVLATQSDRSIETAIGLDAIRKLFLKIKPNSTIRRYIKCTAPLTYNVPKEEIALAEELIPDGLTWCGDFDENMVCTCPKN